MRLESQHLRDYLEKSQIENECDIADKSIIVNFDE